MQNHLWETADNRTDRDQRRWITYRNSLGIAFVGYAAILVTLLLLVPDESPSAIQRLAMLLPVIPAAYGATAVGRFIQTSDEMQQLVLYKSMAVGFAASILVSVSVGFAGLPGQATLFSQLSPWIVFAAGMLAWGVAAGVLTARQQT